MLYEVALWDELSLWAEDSPPWFRPLYRRQQVNYMGQASSNEKYLQTLPGHVTEAISKVGQVRRH